jgi:hypothetical protein
MMRPQMQGNYSQPRPFKYAFQAKSIKKARKTKDSPSLFGLGAKNVRYLPSNFKSPMLVSGT